jgi:hypothetical protein
VDHYPPILPEPQIIAFEKLCIFQQRQPSQYK